MENNTVLKGENGYYGIPSFKLNATINAQSIKNKLLNMLSDFYTNNIMANMRGYIAQFNPSLRNSYRTNNAFTETELNALRQAVINREAYLKNHKGARNITYDDYGPSKLLNKPIFAPAIKDMDTIIRLQNSKDPVWDMQTTIGNARYMVDPDGRVTLEDTYNFNKGTNMENPTINILHTIGKIGNSYPIRIDLGRISNWDMGPNYQ